MSNTTENVLTKTYSGKFGNQVVFRNRGDKSIMAKMPRKNTRPVSAAQSAVRRKFKVACRWAKLALQDPDTLAAYQAQASGMKTPFVLAVTNYLRPPEVRSIVAMGYSGAAGGKICVEAFDDFRVTGVTVKITDASGTVIEQGPCQEDLAADCWVYTATVSVTSTAGATITAEASDFPGHTGLLAITL